MPLKVWWHWCFVFLQHQLLALFNTPRRTHCASEPGASRGSGPNSNSGTYILRLEPAAPRGLRRASRPCLMTAHRDIILASCWWLEVSDQPLPCLRLAGTGEINEFRRPECSIHRTDLARAAVVRGLQGLLDHTVPGLLKFFPAGHRLQTADTFETDRLLSFFRSWVQGKIYRTIESGGYDAVLALARPRAIGHPTPKSLLAPGALADDLAQPSAWVDPLRMGWEDHQAPSDPVLTKAVKYVFGQGWSLAVPTDGRSSFELLCCPRFKPHVLGRFLGSETDRARTAVFRAVSQLVAPVGSQSSLWSMASVDEKLRVNQRSERAELLQCLRTRLKLSVLSAVENRGYDGLQRLLQEAAE